MSTSKKKKVVAKKSETPSSDKILTVLGKRQTAMMIAAGFLGAENRVVFGARLNKKALERQSREAIERAEAIVEVMDAKG